MTSPANQYTPYGSPSIRPPNSPRLLKGEEDLTDTQIGIPSLPPTLLLSKRQHPNRRRSDIRWKNQSPQGTQQSKKYHPTATSKHIAQCTAIPKN
jgi:hypothetical protein